MPKGDSAERLGGSLETSLDVLQQSAEKTMLYFIKSVIFYLALITVLTLNLIIAHTAKDRGFSIGVLILLGLGLAGLWISPLRGLRSGGFTLAGFFNLFRLPFQDRLEELRDARKWSDEAARRKAAAELVERVAAEQRETKAWPNRLLSLVVVTVIDLLIWLVWKNPLGALLNQVIATIVSQVHLTWAPTTAIRAEEPAERVPA